MCHPSCGEVCSFQDEEGIERICKIIAGDVPFLSRRVHDAKGINDAIESQRRVADISPHKILF